MERLKWCVKCNARMAPCLHSADLGGQQDLVCSRAVVCTDASTAVAEALGRLALRVVNRVVKEAQTCRMWRRTSLCACRG